MKVVIKLKMKVMRKWNENNENNESNENNIWRKYEMKSEI